MRTSHKIEEIPKSESLFILRHLVYDPGFIKDCPFIEPWMFETPEMQKVAEFALEFTNFNINQPPLGGRLREIAARHSSRLAPANPDLFAALINELSTDTGQRYTEYNLKGAEGWANIQVAKKKAKELQRAIDAGDADTANSILSNHKPITRAPSIGFDLAKEFQKAEAAFNEVDNKLFRFPGALGDMIGNFQPADFVAYMGPAKRGKTWWLIYSATQASQQGCRVLYLNLEMRESQVLRRIWQHILSLPKAAGTYTMKIPVYGNEGLYHETKTQTWTTINARDLENRYTGFKQSYNTFAGMKINSFPTGTLSVQKLDNMLDMYYSSDGWAPQVIVIDYADLMQSHYKGVEERHRLNEIWTALRGLSLKWDCCIITATQSGRTTFDGKDVNASDVSEDSRKITHITKLITLNQSKVEKEDGVMRLESSVQRDDSATFGQVVCLQNLTLGQVCLQSVPAKEFRRIGG